MRGSSFLLFIFGLASSFSYRLSFESVKQEKVYSLSALTSVSSTSTFTAVYGSDLFYWTPARNDSEGYSDASIVQVSGNDNYVIADASSLQFNEPNEGSGIHLSFQTTRNCGPQLGPFSTGDIQIICDSSISVPEFSFLFADNQLCNITFQLKTNCNWVYPLDNSCNPSHADDCGSSTQRGECLLENPSDLSGFCDCYPGYQGSQCSFDPLLPFSQSSVYPQNLELMATMDYSLSNQVSFLVSLPSEKGPSLDSNSHATTSTLRFNGGGSKECDYPNSLRWNLSNNATHDFYSASFTYVQMHSCGLVSTGLDSTGNYHVFENSLTVLRKYRLRQEGNNFPFLNRTVGPTFGFSFLFPKKVSVNLEVDMVDNHISTFTAATGSSFNQATNQWSFQFNSLVAAPYQLSLSSPPSFSGNDASRLVSTASLSSCSGDVSSFAQCDQLFTIQAFDCMQLEFQVVANFSVNCRATAPVCADAATLWFLATFKVEATNSCPLEKDVAVSNLAMISYKDVDLSIPNTVFGQSETVYFAVAFGSSAIISSASVSSVCVSATPITEDCSSGTLFFTQTSPSDGYAVHFIGEAQVQTAFSFNGNQVSRIVPLSKFQSTIVYIQADLTVNYDGFVRKRSVQFNAVQNSIMMQGEKDSDPSLRYKDQHSNSSLRFVFSALFPFTALVSLILCVMGP